MKASLDNACFALSILVGLSCCQVGAKSSGYSLPETDNRVLMAAEPAVPSSSDQAAATPESSPAALPSKEAVAAYQAGMQLVGQNRIKDAADQFRRAAELAPQFVEARVNLGSALTSMGNYAAAVPELQKAAELKPDQPVVWLNLALCQQNLGQLESAATSLRKTVELAPQMAEAHANLGAALGSLGNAQEGLAELQKAIEINPKLAPAWLNLGSCQQSLGHTAEAISAFKKYLELEPTGEHAAKINSLVAALSNELKRSPASGKEDPNSYLSDAVGSGMARWPANRIPITVYFKPGNGVPGYRPEFVDIVKSALKEWEEASNGQIRFTIVNNPDQAEITCSWTTDPKEMISSAEGGHAFVVPDNSGILNVKITLLTTPPAGAIVTPAYAKRVALHEVGHALGIMGHSRDPNDVMFSSALPGQKEMKLSQRDKNTIIALYSTDPSKLEKKELDMSKLVMSGDPNSVVVQTVRLNAEAAEAMKKGNLPLAVQKLELAHKLDPHNELVNGNLGAAYANMAALATMLRNYNGAVEFFQKAVPLIESGTNKANLGSVLRGYQMVLRATQRTEEAAKIDAKIRQLENK